MTENSNRSKILGYVLCALGASFFSTKAIFIKLAYHDTVNATLMLAWRMIFSAPFFLVAGIVAIALNMKKGGAVPKARALAGAAFAGALGYGLSAYLDFKGLEYISAQLERLVLFTYPFFIMFIGSLFFGERISRYGVIACLISYAGLAIVVGIDLPNGGSRTVMGVLLVLGCAITFALNQLFAKRFITILGAVFYTSVSMLAGGLSAVAMHVAAGADFSASPFFLWMSFGCAVFATVLPIFCINEGLARTSAQTVGMISTISPMVTIGMAIGILGEPFTWADALGSFMVLLGVGYYTWSDMRQKQAHTRAAA